MEALGGAASVLTIIEAIATVTKLILACKSATKESRRLVRELSYIRGLLAALEETVKDHETSNDTRASTLLLLNDNNGLLHQFEELLDLLQSRIYQPSNASGLKRLKIALQWPFKEHEALKLIAAVERYKSLIELALDNNHITLSKAIREDVGNLSGLMKDCLQQLAKGNQELGEIHNELTITKENWHQAGQRIEAGIEYNNQKLSQVHEEIRGSMNNLLHTSRDVECLSRNMQDSGDEEIIHRLSTWNFWSRQREVLSQRIGLTGNWFLETAEFNQWKSQTGSWIICYGAPGVGKSVLASVIVNHLHRTIASNSLVLAFYFDRAYQPNDRYDNFLGSLLQQLMSYKPSAHEVVQHIRQTRRSGRGIHAADLLMLLRRELQGFNQAYIIIDALDEWSTETQDLKSLLSDLGSLGNHINFLITSRALPQCKQLFAGRIETDIQPPYLDLENYVRSRLEGQNLTGFLSCDRDLQNLITQTVLENCQGLFLLARLQMDLLKGKASKKALKNTLRRLPQTPECLYDEILARLETQNSEEIYLAKQTFAWVLSAREPPHRHLIQYALAIEPGEKEIDEDGIVDWDVLTSLCGGLIISDEETLTVRFVHPTTRAYFQAYFERQTASSGALITCDCLTFLMSNTFKGSITDEMRTGQFYTPQFSGHPFMRSFITYAARYLISHCLATEEEEITRRKTEELFSDTPSLENLWTILRLDSVELFGWYLPSIGNADKLCIACFHGLKHIVSKLLEAGISPDEKDTIGQRPIYAAARRGKTEVVRILLSHGARPELRSFDEPSHPSRSMGVFESSLRCVPLECALEQDNINLAQALVEYGAGLGGSLEERSNNFMLAIQSASPQMIEFLLQQQPFESFLVPGDEARFVTYTLATGAWNVFELFFKYGNPATKAFDQALHSAFDIAIRAPHYRFRAHDWILNHMTPQQIERLKTGVFDRCRFSTLPEYSRMHIFPEVKVRFWSNSYNDSSALFGPLWQCLCNDCPEEAAVILTDPALEAATSEEFEQSNVLLLSVYRGWPGVVRSLLEMACNFHCKSKVVSAALAEAIECQRNELLPLIMEYKPDINAALPCGNILSVALLSQDLGVVDLLLQVGASINARCSRYGSALHAVCCDENIPVPYTQSAVHLLLSYGADLNLICNDRGTVLTALAFTSSERSIILTQGLLQLGADCNIVGGTHHTPLIASAVSKGASSLHMMWLLHESGADVNAISPLFGTAFAASLEPETMAHGMKTFGLFEWGADVTIPGPKGTPTELATQSSYPAVRGLFGVKDHTQSDLQYAFITATASGLRDTMIHLIERGVDVNCEVEIGSTTMTPLMVAMKTIHGESSETLALLIALGANMKLPLKKGSLQNFLNSPRLPRSVFMCIGPPAMDWKSDMEFLMVQDWFCDFMAANTDETGGSCLRSFGLSLSWL